MRHKVGKLTRTIAIIWVGNNEGLSWRRKQGEGKVSPKTKKTWSRNVKICTNYLHFEQLGSYDPHLERLYTAIRVAWPVSGERAHVYAHTHTHTL